MADMERSGQGPERPEQIVLDGLRAFFANPRHFDHVIFSVQKSTAQLASKLDKITDELVTIDRQSESLEQTAGNVLSKVSTQKISEGVGAAIVGSVHERLLHLCRRRATLEVHEAWLGKEIAALQAFERAHPWCRLYLPGPQARAAAALSQLGVDSVVVYIRPPGDPSIEKDRR